MESLDHQAPPLENAGRFNTRRGRRVWPLTVTGTGKIAPRMMRVSFKGPDIDELVWKRGQDIVLVIPQSDGPPMPRHYTIRHHNAAARTLDIDFVLHGDSPVGRWLEVVAPGDALEAVGPRGHTVLNLDADWHLFCGDETCIPGIFAMIEALPEGARAFVFIEIQNEGDRLSLDVKADVTLAWLSREGAKAGPSTIILDAVERIEFPQGHGHAYVIGETSNVRAVRHRLLERGLTREQITAEGYWRPGRIGGHDHV